MNEISDKKLDKYLDVTEKAIRFLKISVPEKTHLRAVADDFLDMAKRYLSDAKHFRSNGDYVNAFAAVNYAHGWLDAGARLRLFDVKHNSKLFTVD